MPLQERNFDPSLMAGAQIGPAAPVNFGVSTVSFIAAGGAFDASALGATDPVFVLNTTAATAITTLNFATTANTALVRIQVGGTVRYLRVYD